VAIGKHSEHYSKGLLGGITMASTRYLFGDELSREKYSEVSQLPQNNEGLIFSKEITKVSGNFIQCVPTLLLHSDNPHTIGLGDTFVGGFIAAII
jgi:ADP-dependent phosphofructokinase/glucokinase